jgi:hypothetical protein
MNIEVSREKYVAVRKSVSRRRDRTRAGSYNRNLVFERIEAVLGQETTLRLLEQVGGRLLYVRLPGRINNHAPSRGAFFRGLKTRPTRCNRRMVEWQTVIALVSALLVFVGLNLGAMQWMLNRHDESDTLIRLVQQIDLEILLQLDAAGIGEADPRALADITRSVATLARASLQQKRWIAETRARLEAQVAAAGDQAADVARRGGLSDAAAQHIRNALLDIKV